MHRAKGLIPLSIVTAFTLPALADPVWLIRPEPGLICASVTAVGTQILEHPRSGAPSIATAGRIVFTVQPAQRANGYVEVQRPNKQVGWILQTTLTNGPEKCVPTLTSSGLILPGTAP